MKILIIGSGGREHTFAWKIAQSSNCDQLFIAPGNAGTDALGINLSIDIEDFSDIANTIIKNNIELVVVGPEDPLVKGIKDYLTSYPGLENIMIIGPDKNGAKLEGSKAFSKEFMTQNDIPTASAQTFNLNTLTDGMEYLSSIAPPYVLKADGLAAGKGVIISESLKKAQQSLSDMVNGKFGEASMSVLIEEFLAGIECSVFVITDGNSYKILPEAKDYKRIGENDTGPNTGGMGAVSPVGFVDAKFMRKVEDLVVKPTFSGLQKTGIDYSGFLFIGLMNVNGDPYVIEYNVRMGDPESQVVLPRINNDFVELLEAVARKTLHQIEMDIISDTAATVVLVAEGYPHNYKKGMTIQGLKNISKAILFHAGTKKINERVVTNGGRVLAVTGIGSSLKEALEISYQEARKISWDGLYFRNDIGGDLLKP